MNIIFGFLLIFFAGIINGSYPLPTKHMPKWSFENLWLLCSLFSFFLFPWLFAIFTVPTIFSIYQSLPKEEISLIVLGGCIFGFGQLCFAWALDVIGFGLSFVISSAVAIIFGFTLPLIVQHSDKIFSLFGVTTLTGCICATLGLIFSTFAGNNHNLEKINNPNLSKHPKKYFFRLGIFIAVFSGLASAFQNFTFSFTVQSLKETALNFGASEFGAVNIMWPFFLSIAFIPYAATLIFLNIKRKSFHNYFRPDTKKYYLFAIYMAIFAYGSVLLYSKSAQMIGNLGPIFGWPLFMVLIILTSNFWGWHYGEWRGASDKTKRMLLLGLGLLASAVLLFGISAGLQ